MGSVAGDDLSGPAGLPGSSFGWAEPGDAEEVSALFKRVFGKTMSPEGYRWLFSEAPEGEGRCGVVRHGGRIISHVGYLGRQCLVDGEEGRAALKFTSMTDPEYQGRGVYTALMQWAHAHLRDDDFDFVLSWPNVRNHPSQRNRTDFEDIYQIPALKWVPEVGDRTRPAAGVPLAEASELALEEWEPVALRTCGEARYSLDRSGAYLKWRYQQRPDVTYYGIESRKGCEVEAALLFKLYPEDEPDRISVVEWLCNPHGRSGEAVLEDLEDYAGSIGLPVMMWHNVHDYPRHHLLERRGYVPSEPIFYFGVFALAGPARLGVYRDWAAWHVSMGDVDVF